MIGSKSHTHIIVMVRVKVRVMVRVRVKVRFSVRVSYFMTSAPRVYTIHSQPRLRPISGD